MNNSGCSSMSDMDETVPELQLEAGPSKINIKSRRSKGENWADIETDIFIQLCIEKRILKLMDGKKYKHIDIYKTLEPEMKERGFIKTAAQMKTKLKHLKESYYKCKRNNSTSGHDRMSFTHYEAMEELLGNRPTAQAISDVGIDSSLIEDNINAIQLSNEEADRIPQEDIVNAEIEIEDVSDATPIANANKKGSGGRKCNAKRAEEFSDLFLTKQQQIFSEMLKTQNKSLEESMERQMAEQRRWESEMMQRDHANQMQQMSMIMDGFLKGLQMLQNPQQPMYYQPNQLVHLPYPSQTFSQSSPLLSPPLTQSQNSQIFSPPSNSSTFTSASPSPNSSTCPSPSSFPMNMYSYLPTSESNVLQTTLSTSDNQSQTEGKQDNSFNEEENAN